MDCDKLKEECDCEHCMNIKEQIKQAGKQWDEKTESKKRDIWFKGSRDRGLR
tara:strand:- start:251 stop:406 length:156 start_codon:yes stop_codon:yes gene_type:complete